MLNGVGFGIHSTAAGAVAADVIPKSRMMEGMGYFFLYATIAFAIAPGISLSIIGEGQIEKFRFLFILASLVALLSMALDSCITYERRRGKSPVPTDRKEGEKVDNIAFNNTTDLRILPNTFFGFEYGVFLPAFLVLLIYFSQSSVMSFLPLYSLEFKMGNIGLFYTFLAIGMFMSRLSTGKIGDKHGSNIVIIPALTILMLSYLLIPFIHTWIILLLTAFPIGFAIGAVTPTLNALIINKCSPYHRGTASAAFFSAVDLGVGVGSIFFGFIITFFTYTYMFWGSFVFTFLSLIIYIFGLAKKRTL
jgi:MFS family permease